jgi:hypothetical protein
MPPLSLIFAGHEIAVPCFVPPKNDAICLVHLKGVSKAQAQPMEKWGYAIVQKEGKELADIGTSTDWQGFGVAGINSITRLSALSAIDIFLSITRPAIPFSMFI